MANSSIFILFFFAESVFLERKELLTLVCATSSPIFLHLAKMVLLYAVRQRVREEKKST